MLTLVTAADFIQLFFGWEGRGPGLLPADRLLVPEADRQRRRHQGLRRQPRGRLRLRARHHDHLLGVRLDPIPRDLPGGRRRRPSTHLGVRGPHLRDTVDIACLLLFIGAMGKSAQFFLHTWLPDAMEGPTPVSALIHAATMVTAGVYMVCLLSPMFEYAPVATSRSSP